jgi:hypothetical protein
VFARIAVSVATYEPPRGGFSAAVISAFADVPRAERREDRGNEKEV